MARRKTRTLTEAELEIMRVVWKHGEVLVEQIRQEMEEAGKPVAMPTIRTMLGILLDKGYLDRRPEGRAFAYRASISRDEASKSLVRDIVDRAFDGSAMGLVASLLGGRMLSRRDLEEARRLIEKQEKESRE